MRTAVETGQGVVTAVDGRLFVGFQLLYASLRVTHEIDTVVFDLGMNENQRNWCNNQKNLQVRDIDFEVPFRDGPFWQTWNKPFYIEVAGFTQPLWVDSDCIVARSLQSLFASLQTSPLFTPDITPSCNSELYSLLPNRAKSDDLPYVNAGVIGLNLERRLDRSILGSWKYAVQQASLKPSIRSAMRWYDQAALKWAIQSHSASQFIRSDASINYLFPSHYPCSFLDFLILASSLPGTINHFVAGNEKPWERWGSLVAFNFDEIPLHFSDPHASIAWEFIKKRRTMIPNTATSCSAKEFSKMQLMVASLLMRYKTKLIVEDLGLKEEQIQWCQEQGITVANEVPDNAIWIDPSLIIGDLTPFIERGQKRISPNDNTAIYDTVVDAAKSSSPISKVITRRYPQSIKITHTDIADKLALFVLHVDSAILNGIRPRPFLRKINLNELPLGEFSENTFCENRAYLSEIYKDLEHDYIGFASARWNMKYPHILSLEDLYLLEPHLAPNKVFVAEKTMTKWLSFSETYHVGLSDLLKEMAQFMDIELTERSSFWANNFICHREVFAEFIDFWRIAFDYFYRKYGLEPPIGINCSGVSSLKVAYLLERITTAYFAQRTDLEIVQITGNKAWYYEP